MAKSMPAQQLALEALGRLLGDPSAKVLHGSKSAPGVFAGGSAGEKAAARLCLDHGWLEATGEVMGKGKTKKELYRITPAGLHAIFQQNDSSALLHGLTDSLKTLAARTEHVPEILAAGIDGLVRQLDSLKVDVQNTIAQALRPVETARTTLQALQDHIAGILNKMKPVDLDELTSKLAAGRQASPPAARSDDWGAEVVHLAAEQKQRHAFQRLTLPQVFERLRARWPELTLGQFHDGLRRLRDDNKIRLSPYTQALATIDDPRNALFLDREVKFYVELP